MKVWCRELHRWREPDLGKIYAEIGGDRSGKGDFRRVAGLDHMVDGIRDGHATAVLAASIFHFGAYTIGEAKEYMAAAGLPMRLDPHD